MIGESTMTRIVLLLAGLTKNASFYPEGHPTVAGPLAELHSLFAESEVDIAIGVADGILFGGDTLFPAPRPAMKDLLDLFTARKIPSVAISPTVSMLEIKTFVLLLGNRTIPGEQLADELKKANVSSIRIRSHGNNSDAESGSQDSLSHHLETYQDAISAIQGIWKDVESGRIPNSGVILGVVEPMVTATIECPSTLLGLSMIKNYDNYTFHHSVNVGILAMALAAAAEKTREEITNSGVAGMLHDVGKTKVDKNITNKPGGLAPAEFEEMKKHSEFGAEIIAGMPGIGTGVADAVLCHHIHFNRRGYPEWAKSLPFGDMCEIVTIADMYDAITTLRVYQRPLTPKEALDCLRADAGKKLNPQLVDIFVNLMGLYPVGTLVRLDTNELAVVCRPNPADASHPTVKIVSEESGGKLIKGQVVPLVSPAGTYASIVSVINPLTKNINVMKILLEG